VDFFSEIQLNEAIAGDVSKQFKKAWSARGLIDYYPDSRKILTYQKIVTEIGNAAESIRYFKTDLYDQMPRTIQLVQSITRRPQVTRLFSLKAGTELPWHTHYLTSFKRQDYKTIVFQIPLLNSEQCLYEVRGRGSKEVYGAVYRPGEIWVFNSYHDHRVLNRASLDRISLFIETRLEDLTMRPLIQRAIDHYIEAKGLLF
jgi:hypothetical protein